MRILFASTAYKPAYRMGGAVTAISGMAEALVRAGHRVTVATTTANLNEDLDVAVNTPIDVNGVTVWYFRREEPLRKWLPFVRYLSDSSGFAYAPDMKRALARLVADADVVDTHSPFVYPTYLAARTALRLGTPLFYHQHGNFLASHLHRRRLKKRVYLTLFERPVMTRATGLIALAEAERAAFHEIVPDAPCEVVPNGIDVPPMDPDAAQRVQRRWQIGPDAIVILFLARLESWKGASELLETFARIQSRHPNAVLVMAGVDQIRAQERWSGRAARHGFERRLVFAGQLSGRDKEDMLQRADLFCLPSRGEGLSMSMLEALASGTAVVLSPECHFPEAEQSGAGVIVPREISAMTAAIDDLLSAPERLRAMGMRGRALIQRDYSWDVLARRLAAIYAGALTS